MTKATPKARRKTPAKLIQIPIPMRNEAGHFASSNIASASKGRINVGWVGEMYHIALREINAKP